jgi:elongation factor P
MIDINQARKGTTFTDGDDLYKVLDFWHNKPGRGNATVRLSVRNLRTGTNRDVTYNSGQRVQDIEVEERTVQFLYDDGDHLTFMDMESFEQPQLKREMFGDDVAFLKENLEITLNTYEGEIIDYQLPINIDYKVIEADPSFMGDTAGAGLKRCVIETGRTVMVPPFVNVGDTIRVKAEDGSYQTRV